MTFNDDINFNNDSSNHNTNNNNNNWDQKLSRTSVVYFRYLRIVFNSE